MNHLTKEKEKTPSHTLYKRKDKGKVHLGRRAWPLIFLTIAYPGPLFLLDSQRETL